ncbi:MAG: YetF domain-containing protein [Nocardioidaceae bacterium]
MEIIVRALVVFFFLWVVTRVVGRASLSEVTTFELLIYVTMGDLVQQSVTQQDYSLTSAFLAVGMFALLTIGLSYSSWRWPRLRPLIRGTPVMVMRSGALLTDVMRSQRLATDDLMAAAREQGIRRLTDVDVAVLETDGKISFFEVQNDGGGEVDDSGAAEGASTRE